MYGSFERPSPWVRPLRFLALFLLAYQARLILKDLVSLSRMLGIYTLLFLAGTLLGRTRLRLWLRVAIAAALPFALRILAFAIFRGAGVFLPGSGSDALFPSFDETFFPLLPLWWWTAAASDLSERSPRFTAFEAGADLLVLAALLWSQGGFKVTLYPHPSLLGAAASLLCFLSLALLAALRPLPAGRRGGAWARLGAFFAALALILLFTLGRYSDEASARGGGLLKPTLFRFDLSRYLKLETEISLSDDLVLLVRKDTVDTNIFLRRFILSEYDPRGVFRPGPPGTNAPENLPKRQLEWDVPPWIGRALLHQEFWVVNLDPGVFLAIDAPLSVTPYRLESGSSFSSAYSVLSSAPEASLPLLLEGFNPEATPPAFRLSPEDFRRYTQWGKDTRIRDLAREAAAEAGTYYEKTTAVLSFLRDNYYYSLKPGAAPDGNQLAYFLFEGRKGYCSYFAFSMAVMLRSLGIPARVAAGFFLDPDTAVLEFHPVRADMAHAWTEVWFGEYGWVAFDPTSTIPAPGERFEESRGTDPGMLERLLREILRGKAASVPEDEGRVEMRPPLGERFRAGALWAVRRVWFLLPALYLALIAAARGARALWARRATDKRRRTLAAWDSLEQALAVEGRRRRREESVPDFGDRLDREAPGPGGAEYGALARDWERVLYASDPGVGPLFDLERRAGALRARVIGRTGMLRRAASFLDIRNAFRRPPGARR